MAVFLSVLPVNIADNNLTDGYFIIEMPHNGSRQYGRKYQTNKRQKTCQNGAMSHTGVYPPKRLLRRDKGLMLYQGFPGIRLLGSHSVSLRPDGSTGIFCCRVNRSGSCNSLIFQRKNRMSSDT